MIYLLEPPAFVWCVAGPHTGEDLVDIVAGKRAEIERFGWCLWAYGGTGSAHPENEVRRLARDYGAGGSLPLLMPDTETGHTDDGVPFTGYRIDADGPAEALPDGMSPVTGGPSSWAFRITSLRWSDEAVVDVTSYVAPYAQHGAQPLGDYLKGSHGRACAARAAAPGAPDERRVDVLATLQPPYAVFLSR
ncbi:MAG: hypothetical protein ACLGIO_08040 [Acidimicrobiia bacterium]